MNQINPLPTKDAIQLNKLLSPYLPELDEKTPLQFIGKIIENIRTSNHPEVYLEAIAIMHRTTVDEIINCEISSESALNMFVEGLEANRIIALHLFCQKVGL